MRKKVAVVGLRGVPNIMGGIESHCEEIYSRMSKNEDFEYFLYMRKPYIHCYKEYFHGAKLVSIPTFKSKFIETILHTFISIIHMRLFVRPDIVHIHAIGPGLFTGFAKLLGFKVVVTHHGADFNRDKWGVIAKFILRLGEGISCKYADYVIVVGKSLTMELKRKYSHRDKSLEHIPNGASMKMELSEQSEEYSEKVKSIISYDEGYILTVGRLVPEKGFMDLVFAYKNTDTKKKLVIVGDSDHRDEYYNKLVSFEDEEIIFLGFRKGVELDALYKNAKLFILPSYHEGLPVVALEAMAYNLPVILSDITPNLDIGLELNNYFKLGDVSSLSDKIDLFQKFNYSRDYKELLLKYNWDDISAKTEKVYEELL